MNHRIHSEAQHIIPQQATINIGMIGHVSHGKSTIVKCLSGVKTVRSTNELQRGITIDLGYANAKIYRCDDPGHLNSGDHATYTSRGSQGPLCFPCPTPTCKGTMHLKRHISFVDAPGHNILMATMLTGAAIMDSALLLVAANECCPQPQTMEHLAAVEIMKLENILILQNKIDLVDRERARKQYQEIQRFTKGTMAEKAMIIPTSAQIGINCDIVCKYICEHVPIPTRNLEGPLRFVIVRSFDINKPGTQLSNLKGGVIGGTILQGTLSVGDRIEIRPGLVKTNGCESFITTVTSLMAEKNSLQTAYPGGLIAVGTQLDPSLCKGNGLVGQVMGFEGHLPPVLKQITVEYYLLRRLLGVSEGGKIEKLKQGEALLVNVGSFSTGGKVNKATKKKAVLSLNSPCCCDVSNKIAMSRRMEGGWRLIGWGKILDGDSPTEIVV